jgi:hypothetical protein
MSVISYAESVPACITVAPTWGAKPSRANDNLRKMWEQLSMTLQAFAC